MATINEEKRGRAIGVGFETVVRGTMTAEATIAIPNVPAHADKLYVDAILLDGAGAVSRPTDITHSSGTDTVDFGGAVTGTVYYRVISAVKA